jgi:hypothetical protein
MNVNEVCEITRNIFWKHVHSKCSADFISLWHVFRALAQMGPEQTTNKEDKIKHV